MCNDSVQFLEELFVFDSIQEIQRIPWRQLHGIAYVKETFSIFTKCLSIKCEKPNSCSQMLNENRVDRAIHCDAPDLIAEIWARLTKPQNSQVIFQSWKWLHSFYDEFATFSERNQLQTVKFNRLNFLKVLSFVWWSHLFHHYQITLVFKGIFEMTSDNMIWTTFYIRIVTSEFS